MNNAFHTLSGSACIIRGSFMKTPEKQQKKNTETTQENKDDLGKKGFFLILYMVALILVLYALWTLGLHFVQTMLH